jgi:ribosomal protein L11 methyltransferase
MADYLEYSFEISPIKPWTEILIAQLAEIGFDSFVETSEGCLAYGEKNNVQVDLIEKETLIGQNLEDCKISYTSKVIPQQNWNEQWESQFEPVYVEDKVAIIAPFHEKTGQTTFEIEILPKMSFGTGHHQTTYMMAKAIYDLAYIPQIALDMGTGTGVLAILLEKKGCNHIVAVDIEDWSVENTIENAERNNCSHIEAILGDIDKVPHLAYDFIVANINKNILMGHIETYANLLLPDGKLMLSGFFNSDVDQLVEHSAIFGLKLVEVLSKDNWAGIVFKK